MVWPIDADVVTLIFAVGQIHNTVGNSAGVGGQVPLPSLCSLSLR